jgi:hypothetical protein
MNKVWETIKSYIWWTHPRASFHYDVMVTLILVFIFASPHFLNYKDKPAERLPRPKSVLVMPDGDSGLIFRVDARDVKGATNEQKQADLQRVIEPISGYVKIKKWTPEQDTKGELVAYKVWVQR